MKRVRIILMAFAMAAVLTGCAEPGHLPETSAEATVETEATAAVEAAQAPQRPQIDLNGIREDLDALTENPRPVGSAGEREAVRYLKARFEEMGYAVTVQPYVDQKGNTGSNVIALKEAADPEADILVLSSHHDSAPTSYGANDNASGVAAMLAAAEQLKDTNSDTELRFISFTDEENGKNGSRYYISTLPQEELDRMVGCIQLDMLGGLGSEGLTAATMDGQGNFITDLFRENLSGLELTAETASDHASFQLAGVPSVLLMQKGRGYLYHTAADKADQLDLETIAQAASLAAQTAEKMADPETSSYRALARRQSENYTYCQTRQNVIYFDASLADTESYIGAPGELVDQQEIKGEGWTDQYDTYLYSMRWFNGKNPMNTYYCYRNGYLQNIQIRPFETDYTIDEVRALLGAMYGDPTSSGTDREDRPYEAWQDEIYGKHLTLTDDPEGFTVSVGKFNVGVSNLLATYEVRDGEAQITKPEDAWVWELLCSILPQQYRQKITQFQLFTDGASNILAYTSPVREDGITDNSRFSMTVDYYDVYDENGTPRDWSKLTYTLLHEYGHVLLEDETQIDLTAGESTHDPAGFIEGSFRKAFYDKFWADLGDSAAGDYEVRPTAYVSRYGANYFHEDIADTFAVFVLGGKPAGDTVAEEKLLFFWDYPEMVALRTAVRQNLGLN